ncbi:MAG TPA: mandelate racemase/muconate lactonizing enzyme family protein [Bryobacteraceae bacterium]|nr:mandelate racemase/muconate lactonizing enzyme family protein [Bryobacteraceae bacterium]
MNRRKFFSSALAAAGGATVASRRGVAAIPKMKIRRIRYYQPPRANPTFNQSNRIVTIETDAGITGVGEGGSKDMMEQCAPMLIGEDPSRTDHLWQFLYRGWFYPPGREKLHALGALDMALWDIKGKALGVPVYQILGGLSREHIECYSTGVARGSTLQERARAVIEAGFRAYRTALDMPWSSEGGGTPTGVFQPHVAVDQEVEKARQIREGVGKEGDWLTDVHTRLDLSDAVRLCSLLEPFAPYEVEDPLRSENKAVYRDLRARIKVPIAVGEQFGDRWDINELIEQRLIDYSRITLPNAGGITEFMKIATLCETHNVGLIPHATGPISVAALTHTLGAFAGPVLMECGNLAKPAYLPQGADFHNGKLWPRDAPGLGVEFDPKGLDVLADITVRSAPIPIYKRPDGSITNW